MQRRDVLKATVLLPLFGYSRFCGGQESALALLHPTYDLGDALGADAIFKIGGSDLARLVPNINVGKWSDEAWVNLNHRDTLVGSGAVQELIDGKPTLILGDLKHVFYPQSVFSLEHEIWLSAKPAKNWIRMEIQDSGGLRYDPQPALTPEQIIAGDQRPDPIVGSIAVYYEKTGDFIGGQQYGIGKFGHWYRWKVTDANDNWAWCEDLKIDIVDGTTYLVAALPPAFMAQAAYPVCIGPEFGNTNIGASYILRDANIHVLKGYTGISGTANSVAAYFNDGNDQSITMGVYSGASNPLSLEDDTGTVTATNNTPGWYSSDLDTGFALSSGSTYYPAAGWKAAVQINYDSSTNASDRVSYTAASGTLDDPISPTLTESELYSIKVTYTEGGGAPSAAQIF